MSGFRVSQHYRSSWTFFSHDFFLNNNPATRGKTSNLKSENIVPFRKVKKKCRKSDPIPEKAVFFRKYCYIITLSEEGSVKRVFKVFFVICVVICTFVAIPSYANSSGVLVGNYGDWNVYTFLEGGKKVCFMSGQPRKKEGKYKKRGEVFFFVTHWFGEGNKNVVSISNGYSFKEGVPVTVSVGGKKFTLFTRDEMAWTENQKDDDALVALLKKKSSLVVRGTSSRGTKTTDTYSLKGTADAWRRMTGECKAKKK